MKMMKYTIIKSEEQYNDYCESLSTLVFSKQTDQDTQDEIEMLTLLIEKWDNEHNTFKEFDPIELLKALMKENNLISKDLMKILNVSKGLISSVLNYRRGLSKENIRLLSEYFKISQEAFNRPYKLDSELNRTKRIQVK
jgi:HTH-type transcriptional regulator/antitoxin HigA